MPDPKRVRVATAALRRYRDYLRDDAGPALEAIRSNIDSGRLPTDAWGVMLRSVLPHTPDPEGGPMRGGRPIVGGPQAVIKFKQSYEAAHAAAIGRLAQLCTILDENARALHRIADHYDEDEERGQRAAERAAEQ